MAVEGAWRRRWIGDWDRIRSWSWTSAGVLELITLGSCLVNNAQRNGTAHGNAQSRENREQRTLAKMITFIGH